MKKQQITVSRIKKLRLEQGLTQKELADKLGVTQQTYSNCENEKKGMDLEMLTKLCNYFDVSADYILGLDEIPQRATQIKESSEANTMKLMRQIFISDSKN